ncbi:hypothetical protein Emag_007901 [Eimeria magna]
MTTRCVWWALTAARDYKTAKENFEQRLQELQNEQQRGLTVTDDQVEHLVGFWLSSAERLAALMGPGKTALREFFNGVYRTGQALLGATVAAAAPAAPVADPAASPELATPARSSRVDHPSPALSTPGGATPPPPPPDPRAEEFRLPEPAMTTRSPPLQLGMHGLLNGSAGRSPAGDESVPPVCQESRSATELSESEQPAAKRVRTPGR